MLVTVLALGALLLGLLMAQYTFTGYDASAHVSEETHDAQVAAPRGIVNSVVVSLAAGFALLFAVTWAIQDYEGARTSATGFPPAQIFIDAAGRNLGLFLLFVIRFLPRGIGSLWIGRTGSARSAEKPR